MSEPPSYRWLVVLGFAFAVAAIVLGLLFAAIPVVIGGVLATSGRRRAGIALIVTTVVLVGAPRLALIGYTDAVGGKTYRIPTGAMEPTIRVGDRIFAQDDGSPGRGDIYVHRAPVGCGARHWGDEPCPRPGHELAGTTLIHRIVGLPGERVKVLANRVYVDGRRLAEPHVRTTPCSAFCNLPRQLTVPPGHYFMLGDNRGKSRDSRDFGPIPKAWLLKRAWFRYTPLSRLGEL